MKKFVVFSTAVLSTFLFSGCSTQKSKTKPIQETVATGPGQIQDDIFMEMAKSEEYTHEMAEADADDQKIKQEVGANELDDDIKEETSDSQRSDFLLRKRTKRMQFWVEYFTKKNHERFQRFINNGEEYRHIIEKVFESHGLPKELYYVGLIESGYYLGAKSHASAVGPWQFIKGTGKRYGLRITPEIDERQDLFKASNAAAMYFKDLHNVFSSWELALSAYNAGEYGIIRRIMKHGTRDFYELSKNKQLPSETINYVPKVLAAMHVVQNAEKYGFEIPKKDHRLFDLTELRPIRKNVPLTEIARRLNVSVTLLRKLNPELKRDATPRHLAGNYFLRVPKSAYSYNLPSSNEIEKVARLTKPESKKEINRRTASYFEQSSDNQVKRPLLHRVRKGETLLSISRKYNISPRELASFNGFKTWNTRVKRGQSIKLFENHEVRSVARAESPQVRTTNRPIVYQVKKGDNLTELARLFDIKVSKIKKANNLSRGKVQIGQKIVLPDTRKGIYIVQKGDHLTKVARELKQPMEALIKLNSLRRGAIYPGQKIIVNMD
jgi:membrane-bound lytic murein transglycosylase D